VVFINISIKKKYIEPFDKLSKNVQNKQNIDRTIEVFEKVKNFKTNVKYLKYYVEKDNFTSDSSTYITYFQNIRRDITAEIFKNINYIRDEVEWFHLNQEKILTNFRTKFHEAIRLMVNIV
jgi:hypothetical protein